MTDNGAKIVTALRQANAGLTQSELARKTGLEARQVREECFALSAQGQINYIGGNYTLARQRRAG